MRKALLAVLIAAASALGAAGSAGASGSGRWICGPRGSAQIPFSIEGNVPIFIVGGMPMHGRKTTAAPPQAYYRIGFGNSRSCPVMPGEGTAYFIPAAGEVRTNGADGNALWVKMSGKLTTRLRKLVRKIKPFPAPRKIRQVVIDDQTAARPASYLHLYTIGTPTRSAPSATQWTPITFYGGFSPWTDGKNVLAVSKSGSYLKRDGQIVRIPASIAAHIRRAQPIPK